jgi:Xaa-Pro dipeptidase
MYARARQIVRPGIEELRVYGELLTAGIQAAGEPFSAYLGNDFACGALGGPPRNHRTAQTGEIYILDLGPAYRGYFADNARSFAVDRNPTDAQFKAWNAIATAFPIIETMAKPGTRCQNIFNAIDQHLKDKYSHGLRHHLGHGIGLQPHEYPHLNPRWDDVLMEGEVFAAEPGLYGPELAGGIRIENNYLVTRDGVENLLTFPMELV